MTNVRTKRGHCNPFAEKRKTLQRVGTPIVGQEKHTTLIAQKKTNASRRVFLKPIKNYLPKPGFFISIKSTSTNDHFNVS